MPWFPFLLADLHSILNHIVPLGCAALLGRWRGQGHTATVSLLSGRASNVNDISIEKGRLDSWGETQRLLRVALAEFRPLLVFSSRVDYLANGRGWTRKTAVLSRLGFAPSSPPEIAS